MKELSPDALKGDYYYTDIDFNDLMHNRISNVLIICSKYDAFMLEEDGRVDEQIFNEYVSLNLRYPPQFIQANSSKQAFDILKNQKIDLVINMLSVGDMDPFLLSKKIRKSYSEIPIVVLTPYSREVSLIIKNQDLSAIDYVFSWLGNADLLLAIVKLIEDSLNANHDILKVGVQSIILVEDSVRFYSSYLPIIYKIIFTQSKSFMSEGLNEHQKTQRMRGRPKILLANNYEEAMELYSEYQNNILGIISDISYKREGKKDPLAGLKLCEKVRADDKFMPFLLQSAISKNKKYADELKAAFIHKRSDKLLKELRGFIRESFAFGDFMFKNPETGEVVARAASLKELQDQLAKVDANVLKYHAYQNHFSMWLKARALYQIANVFKNIRPEHFDNIEEVRDFIIKNLASYRRNKARGIIAKFYRSTYDDFVHFSRVGEGSIGGKARGLAFLDSLLKENKMHKKYDGIHVSVPQTLVLTTDVFDEFMQQSGLAEIAYSDIENEKILEAFVKADLPDSIVEDLKKFISIIDKPLAVRSSSLLEDAHYQPFAGVYSTVMLPDLPDNEQGIKMLANAIKTVYASVYYQESKAYMEVTKNVIDEEKMAIIIQEICGAKYGKHFMPTVSGVSKSLNFYPLEGEKPEEGIAEIAFGLGKYIVDGNGNNIRFSPKHKKKVLQLSTPELAMENSQSYYFALKLGNEDFYPDVNDSMNLERISTRKMHFHKSFTQVVSTYDYNDNRIRDGWHDGGRKLLTFHSFLKYDRFPIAEIIYDSMKLCEDAMNTPVEIEFAIDLDNNGEIPKFNLLQVRPIVRSNFDEDIKLEEIKDEECLVKSNSALGNGVISNMKTVVYVKQDDFDPSHNQEVAKKIAELNKKLLKENEFYVLIGPGRWGSSDSWLGIPIKWANISQARLIVEAGLDDYRVEPSQGTHFFQNLTSFQVGYFTINPNINQGFYDYDYLQSQEAYYEDEFIRCVKMNNPIEVIIDGKSKKGVVLKSKS
jgi:response regulator RpfG family c-di-GMP phosphodiesterase